VSGVIAGGVTPSTSHESSGIAKLVDTPPPPPALATTSILDLPSTPPPSSAVAAASIPVPPCTPPLPPPAAAAAASILSLPRTLHPSPPPAVAAATILGLPRTSPPPAQHPTAEQNDGSVTEVYTAGADTATTPAPGEEDTAQISVASFICTVINFFTNFGELYPDDTDRGAVMRLKAQIWIDLANALRRHEELFTVSGNLPLKGAPKPVSTWVKLPCDPAPAPPPMSFPKQVQRWWVSLQPVWRSFGQDAPSDIVARSWGALSYTGIQGISLAARALWWWDHAHGMSSDEVHDEFLATLRDVLTVLNGMLADHAAGLIVPPGASIAPIVPVSSTNVTAPSIDETPHLGKRVRVVTEKARQSAAQESRKRTKSTKDPVSTVVADPPAGSAGTVSSTKKGRKGARR
jgi:hypothetical protein